MINKCRLIEPVYVTMDATAVDAAKKLKQSGLRQIYVVDKNMKPVGIVSMTDINNRVVAEGKNPTTLKVEEFMTKEILAVDDNDQAIKAYSTMKKRNVGNCPVVKDGKFIGILTIQEAFTCVANQD